MKADQTFNQRQRARGLYEISHRKLEAQRHAHFHKDITISILTPLYNTPESFLKDMISSVLSQTYGKWELCLVDGSDDQHGYVQEICETISGEDSRIRYRKLKENLGISENSNACMDIATGEYCALLDHDDMLHPSALYEIMCVVCQCNADFVYTDEATFHINPKDAYCPNFKPDFSPDTLRSQNYICHLSAFSRDLLDRVGGFRSRFDGSQDYDLILRLTEAAQKITHISKVLYFWRASANSVAADVSAKPYAVTSAKAAITEHLQRLGLEGTVMDAHAPTTYRIQYRIVGDPLVSILIPNKEHVSDLEVCIQSILEKTTYKNFEIIIIENGSTKDDIFSYYHKIGSLENVHVIIWDGPFNYSAINNFGVTCAKGEYILLLNNDVEIITPDWIEQMLMFAQRRDVGAVGAMLYYPNDTIQHAGVILGLGGVAGHSHKYLQRGCYGFMYRAAIAQNLSAVTGACMMMRRSIFLETGGLDEELAVAFNDVDLCMHIRREGYLIVFTPFAELYHHESATRGLDDTPEKLKRCGIETARFVKRWAKELVAGDPYYNPNLTLDSEDFSIYRKRR